MTKKIIVHQPFFFKIKKSWLVQLFFWNHCNW
jgi:hypothetical protein